MTAMSKVLVTGGSGLLGTELRKLIPQATFPESTDFDVTNYEQMDSLIENGNYLVLLHAAAFTSPPKVSEDPLKAIDINIIGTANIVKLSAKYKLKLIYVSTDYVFRGNRGKYIESDAVYPVNDYAWSKLGGECSVRLYDNSLIVRTSFGPDVFPYEKAFVDQWTSRECVSTIAAKVVELLNYDDLVGTIHVGGDRRTVHEYAQELASGREIGELSVQDVDFDIPVDTSLDCSLFLETVKQDSVT